MASLISSLQARMEARSTRDIADNLRARADAANASTELGTAIMAFRQKAHELGEIDDILTQDRLRREHQRREERTDMQFDALIRAEEREERLAEARARRKGAELRERFGASLIETKMEVDQLQAEHDKADMTAALREYVEGSGQPKESTIKTARRDLIEQFETALTSGDHSRANIIKSALDALEQLEK
jgi:hypothetical protein